MGAALLFQAQPAAAKAILPWLGGGPVAWGATLLFFQGLLLAGYGLVDIGLRRGTRWVGLTHLGLLAAGVAALMITPPFATPPEGNGVRVSGTLLWLASQIGLPVLALTLTAPAVQARVAAGRGAADRTVYALYAASNAGSLVGLLAYPFLIEPQVGIAEQWALWGAGLVLLLLLSAGFWLTEPLHGTETSGPGGPRPPRRTRAEWIVRAALPATLLAGVSEYLTRDLAPVPLLWVVPLGLYLVTWIIAFSPKGRRIVELASRGQDVVAVAAVVVLLNQPYALVGPAVALLALVVVGVAQHGALAASAPPTAWLGRFYVHLAAGGALGTSVVVALGPALLPLPIEGPLALAGAVALGAPAGALWTPAGRLRFLVFAALAVAAPFLGGMTRTAALAAASIAAGVLAMRWRGHPRRTALVLAALVLVDVSIRLTDPARIGSSHSVLGRFTVMRRGAGTLLISGSTLHGVEPPTAPGARPLAALYYTRNGPFGDLVRAVEARGGQRRLGVVGLGIGSLSCTAQPGTRTTFFELNPGVIRLARDTTLFQTLRRCAPDAEVHQGDARLTLGAVADRYDLLVLDAFSSDAIPTHLLTREAFTLYRSRTAADGIIAYHVSNRFLDLEPVLGAVAREAGWVAVQSIHAARPSRPDQGTPAEAVTVIAVAADSASLTGLVKTGYWRWIDRGGKPWTDDWAPLASAVRLNRASFFGR